MRHHIQKFRQNQSGADLEGPFRSVPTVVSPQF